MKHIRPNIAIVLCLLAAASAQTPRPMQIDPERSVMKVRVFKTGVFSAFGHEHEISAPIESGSLTEQPPMVELNVNARHMKVEDKDVSEKDRAEIQETMLGPKVLDSGQFPEIRFRSSQVRRVAENKWQLQGELLLHGQSQPLTLSVTKENGAYKGSTELKQKDFGITPVTAGGGTVKTKNEIRIEYEIYVKGSPQ